MKIYTPEEIKEKIKKFDGFLDQEMKLQEELLTLDIHGTRDKVERLAKRHNEILAEIERLRSEEMLPMLEDMVEFIANCQQMEKEGKLKRRK